MKLFLQTALFSAVITTALFGSVWALIQLGPITVPFLFFGWLTVCIYAVVSA